MILYFANRKMEILGHASTNLKDGFKVSDDLKSEDVDTGVATFECELFFDDDTRLEIEAMTDAGNYLLRSHDDENEFYTIIDTETDTERRTIYIYAEDAGLDLINEVVGAYEADEAHTADWYINKYTKDSGFEIGINEIPADSTRTLKWEGEATVTERLASIATQFGGFEVSYSFSVRGMEVTHKYINIYEQRGKDVDDQLRLNKDVSRIVTKKSVANLATALYVTGGTPEGKDKPITLNGYEYDDGDFYVDGKYLKSRNAVAKWSRYVWEKNTVEGYEGHIVKRYSYDTTEQKTLCSHAVTELKKICDTEVNYEVDIAKLPDNIKIGDRINIVDDRGELYLSTRILKLETSIANETQKATLGEYLLRTSGISQKVQDLADQFQELASNRTLYTWIAYADDDQGNGISLDPEGKAYMGTSPNHFEETPDISDPSIYKWQKVKGEDGKQGDPGPAGDTGKGIESEITEYYLSTSSTEPTGGTWSEQMPEWESGKYIWKRNRITWSDGTVTYTDPVLDTALNHANEAADYATEKAEEAATAAGNAQTSATIAQENAQLSAEAAADAQESASTANTNAADAINKANAAQDAADEANAQVTIINGEISSIKSDQTAIRNEMAAEIETVTTTAEATYAKKTDVSTTEMTLRSEFSESVAEVQRTMASDYAKKTELTAVQSSLQTQITQNAQEISSTASSVETVQIDATDAKNKANEAVQTATEAQNTAQTAVSAAQDAQESADAATLAAQTAQTEATKAQTEADTAKQAAEDAKAVADAAQTDLDAAKQNLTNVTNRVDATEEEIAAAQAAVDAAQQKADEANASAAEAQAAADAAQASADTAKQNAATAQATADTATENAAAAQAAADEAKAEADKANAAVGNLANTVTDMQTQITQNAEEIELAATKTEVSEYLSGYYTKEEADSLLSVKANEITATVSSTYATKNELANTNSSVATAQSTADSAKTTAENAQNDIDSLEIGGRNLIKNSSFNSGSLSPFADYDFDGTNSIVDGYNNNKGVNIARSGYTGSNRQGLQGSNILTIHSISKGETYTISAWVRVDTELDADNNDIFVRCLKESNNTTADFPKINIPSTTEIGVWKRYTNTHTFEKDLVYSGFYILLGKNGSMTVSCLKLEKGNKATDWTPAPEDSEEAINSATQAAQDAQESADAATLAAQTAQTEATKAQTEADTAKQAAEDAKAVADAAQTDLDAAKQNLTNVTNRVDATEEEIAAAQAAVDAAQQKADEANASAAEAQAAADAAQASADTAKQNAATAQATADTATENAAAAQAAADEAKAEADKANAAVGNLANTVTDMQTQITQNAEEIELAATKTEVSEYLSGYYTKEEADSLLSVKANEITATVSSTYATKNELANTNSSVATAQSTADSAKTTAENAQNDIDSLEIGGRNLIKNSSFNSGSLSPFADYDFDGTNSIVDGYNNNKGVNIARSGYTGSNRQGLQGSNILTIHSISKGETYTISAWVRVDTELDADNNDIFVRCLKESNNTTADFPKINIPSTTEIGVWKRYTNTHTFEKDLVYSGFYILLGKNGSMTVSCLKLEKGNKATDWTPAPEDSEEAINSATQAAQDAQESANNAQNTANQAQSGVDALESRVTTAETNIIQNTEAIGLRATKTEVQEYLSGYSTKEETESAINLASSSIRAEVNASIGAISGGDNILRGTNVETELVTIDTSTWETGQWKLRGTGTATSYIMTDSPVSSLNIAWTIKGAAYPAKYGGIQQTQITIEPGTYTVSVWAKNTSADSTLSAQLAFYLGNGQIGSTISVGKNWGRYSTTFSTESESITIAFYNPSGITSTDICGMTLNKGETASPWTPSTFDIGDDLTAIRASLELKVDKTSLISEINASANVIRLTGNRFVVDSDNFQLTEDGTMTATSGTFNGSVNATSITAMNRYSIRNEENFAFTRLAIRESDGITTGKSVSRVILGKAVLNSGGDITNHKGVSLIAPVNIYSAVTETSTDCTYSDDDMVATIDETGLATFNKLAVSGISTLGITGFTGTCRPSSEASGNVDLGSTAYPWYNLYLSHCVYYTDPPSGGGTAVYINNNGALVKYSSDRRLKNSIEAVANDELNPEHLYELPIWQYKYNDDVLEDGDDLKGETVIGFMADEVASVYPRACAYDKDGVPTSWNPNVMIPAMLALIQKQKQEIEELRALI